MKITKLTGLTLAISLALPGAAMAYSKDDVTKWLAANQAASVGFKDGESISFKDREKIKAFIPPGYEEVMNFEGMNVVVRDATNLSPSQQYKEATNQFQSKVSLAADGSLQGYVAGEPFDSSSLQVSDPESGLKAAWNFNYRWQRQGLSSDTVHWVWVRKGGSHENHELAKNEKYGHLFGGGGSFDRALWAEYKRVYFNHRADMPEQQYKLKGSMARDTEFREITSFYNPFDIAGTAFMVLRHLNPKKADDSWAYVPSTRRVRRISAEAKTDSLLGTDLTLEDFYGFSGRILDHDWEYVGTARILAVARSRNPNAVYTGPNGWALDDDWELRLTDVFIQKPKSSSHPYSAKYLFTDRQNHTSYYSAAFDQAGELWKVWQQSRTWSEDPQGAGRKNMPEQAAGLNVPIYQSIQVIDVQNDRGTLVSVQDTYYPVDKKSKIKRALDVNVLTEGR
ncbi:MAG: DUF1329 domain-containing protein [Cycloclasticus sp.]